MPPRSLAVVVMLVLQGCCGSDPEYFDEVVHDDHDGTIEAAIVAEIRAAEPSDEGRCEAACLVIVDEADDAVPLLEVVRLGFAVGGQLRPS